MSAPCSCIAEALTDDPGEEAEPELVLEGPTLTAPQRFDDSAAERRQGLAIHVSRHAERVRHGREIQRGLLGRLHVEPRTLVQQGYADTALVEPSPEIALVHTVRRNDWTKAQYRDIEAPQPCFPGADAPFADLLPQERPRPPSRVRVEQPRSLERAPLERHVDAQRYARTELDRIRTVVEQRDDRPVFAAMVRQPRRAGPAPDWEDASSDVVAG